MSDPGEFHRGAGSDRKIVAGTAVSTDSPRALQVAIAAEPSHSGGNRISPAELDRRADAGQISDFVDLLFRYADEGTFVSLRAFYDTSDGVFAVEAHAISAALDALVDAATHLASRCAAASDPVVFCPPIATFADAGRATARNLANGLALSVECDAAPSAARAKLEFLLGPATVIVASGGEWTDPETGEVQDKLHLHWRLSEPTRHAVQHEALKLARALATRLVGGDASNKPIVHPIRWPGSWHRKTKPRLARIVAQTDRELHLQEALERLREASGGVPSDPAAAGLSDESKGEERLTAELVRAVLAAEDYHAPLVALAMRMLLGGMLDAQAVHWLRGIMLAVPYDARDTKGGITQAGRWQARYDDISRAVSTARGKLGKDSTQTAETLDVAQFRLDLLTTGDPPLQHFLLAPLMPLGVVGLIFGPGGVGKSLAALDLCLAVAGRNQFTGDQTDAPALLGGIVPADSAGAAVFVTLEDSQAELHRRTVTLDPDNRRAGLPCFVIPVLELPSFNPALIRTDGRAVALTDFAESGLDQLLANVALAAGAPVRLLVLDPAGDFMEADENSAEAVKPLMRCLRALASRHGCTIILLGHVAKGMDGDALSMRGSSAWVANSRFAYALYRPGKEEAASCARKLGCAPEAVVCGRLTKANHAGAPVGMVRWFRRHGQTGRLIDTTPKAGRNQGPPDEELLRQLVIACGEYAAAGLPYTVTGTAGLYAGRADLPDDLAGLTRKRLETLGNDALVANLLVKARNTKSQGAPKYLDLPDGPIARGVSIGMVKGSRAEALARHREHADASAKHREGLAAKANKAPEAKPVPEADGLP